eukprot:TRINITY_DN363_c0_g1_i2.p1 TRINITY_DN363_c0_g1~~TRINITY_DN363_c0_g1_i2.p1  ORF type:complete len:351 (+),score=183.17 TRINITY_DN363_c0_g1_i2:46-1098(+)
MSQEATMICIDNSEWMRSSDFLPTRLEAQQEAVNIICQVKLQINPESTVGLMTTAGRIQILSSLTTDVDKLLTTLNELKIEGESDVIASLQIAQLALRNRQHTRQQQRIILFVGSPIKSEINTLVALAKQLKKNNVAVDIINFGEDEINTEKLEKFVSTVTKGDSSRLVSVSSVHNLTDYLVSSPILSSEMGTTGFTETGVNPNLDPELAAALELSLAESRQSNNAASDTKATTQVMNAGLEEEDALLSEAIALSLQTAKQENQDVKMSIDDKEQNKINENKEDNESPITFEEDENENEDEDEYEDIDAGVNEDEEDLKMALEMSLLGTKQENENENENNQNSDKSNSGK